MDPQISQGMLNIVEEVIAGVILLVIQYGIIEPVRTRLSRVQNNPTVTIRLTIANVLSHVIKIAVTIILLIILITITPMAFTILRGFNFPENPLVNPSSQPPQISQLPVTVGSDTIRIEDTDWHGGHRRSDGLYGGRTATWVYGNSTSYHTMRTTFVLDVQPVGTALLCIEGMNSEGEFKTDISIRLNDHEIYRGKNLLPHDDYVLERGNWATHCWDIDAELLRVGQNEIQISNLNKGAFSRPPWFMLDYADIIYSYETP